MRRNGFTLLEVLVALVVGALVLVGAHRMLATLTDEAHLLVANAVNFDRRANGERVLRDLVGQLEIGSPGTVPFSGSQDTVRFSSWCQSAAGWLEPCPVTLFFAAQHDQEILRAQFGTGQRLDLLDGFTAGSFRYLQSAAAGGKWFTLWSAGVTAPLGIGVLLVRGDSVDTMLVRIGPRG